MHVLLEHSPVAVHPLSQFGLEYSHVMRPRCKGGYKCAVSSKQPGVRVQNLLLEKKEIFIARLF